MLSEIGIWLERLASLLPQIIMLWEAAKGGNPQHELEAQLALIREVKNRQMREALERQGHR